jgi:hypothetical protein
LGWVASYQTPPLSPGRSSAEVTLAEKTAGGNGNPSRLTIGVAVKGSFLKEDGNASSFCAAVRQL